MEAVAAEAHETGHLGIITEIDLVVGPGMTALTGETGAGKTMVVGAIDLLTGGRADAGLDEGDTVTCGADPEVARFVRFGGHRFHQILKTKFGLSDR